MATLNSIPLISGTYEWLYPEDCVIKATDYAELRVAYKLHSHVEHWPNPMEAGFRFFSVANPNRTVAWGPIKFRQVYHSGMFLEADNPHSLYYLCGRIDQLTLNRNKNMISCELEVGEFGTNFPEKILTDLEIQFPFLDVQKLKKAA